jgi:hypothetical protein
LRYELGMQIVYDLLSQMAVVSFREEITMLGPFKSQKLATEAGEKFCRDRGWIDDDFDSRGLVIS